jgi:hypothetical protein
MDGRQLPVMSSAKSIRPVSTSSRLILMAFTPLWSSTTSTFHAAPSRHSKHIRRWSLMRMLCWPRRSPCKASSRLPAKRANPQAALPHRRGGCEPRGGPASQIDGATNAPANDRPPAILDLRQVDSPTRLHNGEKLTLSPKDRFRNKNRTKSMPHWSRRVTKLVKSTRIQGDRIEPALEH